MDPRTRFLNALHGRPLDRLPFMDPWGSPAAVNPQWVACGEVPPDRDVRQILGFDGADVPGAENGYELLPVRFSGWPEREPPPGIPAMSPWTEVPGEGPVRYRYCTSSGRIAKFLVSDTAGQATVRVFTDTAVHNRADWLRTRRYFRPVPDGRYPPDWARWVAHSRTATHPIGVYVLGLFNCLIDLTIGLEGDTGLLYSVYDRPRLLHEIVAHFTEFILAVYDKALTEARVDFVLVGDQVGAETAPFLSPAHFREFCAAPYRRIVANFRRHTDLVIYAGGNLNPYIPTLAEAGFSGLAGLPRQADMPAIVREYGDRFCYWQCIDKWALLEDAAGMRREVDRKLELAKRVRFVPCLNELLAGVPYANYRRYALYLKERIFAGLPLGQCSPSLLNRPGPECELTAPGLHT